MPPPPSATDNFLYVFSSDVHEMVEIQIVNLDGVFRHPRDPNRQPRSMTVEVTVYSHGRCMGCPVSTCFSSPPSSQRANLLSWNEWLRLPVRYSDLSRDAFLHITLWDEEDTVDLPASFTVNMPSLKAPCSSSIELDDESDEYEDIIMNPSIYRNLIAECSFRIFGRNGVIRTGVIDLQLEMVDIPNPRREPCEPWRLGSDDMDTDRLIREYERRMTELEKETEWLTQFTVSTMEKVKNERKRSQRCLFLVVEMASATNKGTKYDIVHYERAVPMTRRVLVGEGDYELGMDNPCESKHALMTRTVTAADRQLRPNPPARKKLEMILELPPSQPMTREQADLMWRFRYFLSNNNRALTKFLHSVHWETTAEVEHALQLMEEWKPIRAEDALELLSPRFKHPSVRSYAVLRLHFASPDRLQLFLPQLVQALKYEPQDLKINENTVTVEESISDESPDIVEVTGTSTTDDLASFLLLYSTSDLNFANSLFWHLKVEEEALKGMEQGQMYATLRKQLVAALETSPKPDVKQRAKSLIDQEDFVEQLKKETKKAKRAGGREKREAAFRQGLMNNNKLMKLDGLPLPLNPKFLMSRVEYERALFFNSAMAPAKISFKGSFIESSKNKTDDSFTVIFKEGDDLRQDQLVMQMIRLMDSLLKDSQLDLKMTPYSVIATGTDEGFVEFIKAMPLRDVLNTHQSIQGAMRSYRPSINDVYGIEPQVIDNYVRSLAGYSIVCYILGVGDRHMDNLLLCQSGRLFHVDFGFILGRDPKPLPPPMKLTTEMIAALGGTASPHFKKFVTLCDEAFQILRRHATLILNLFSLMLDAGIPDIAIERDKAVSKIEQRLQLHLSDDERYNFIQRLIESSISAKMAVLVDIMHDLKQNLF